MTRSQSDSRAAKAPAAAASGAPSGAPRAQTIEITGRAGLALVALAAVLVAGGIGGWLRYSPGGAAIMAQVGRWPIPEPGQAAWSQMDPDVRQAITQSRADVEANRASAAAWRHLGMVYDAHSLWTLAAPTYARALALEPGDGPTAYYVAHSMDRADFPIDETVEAYHRAIALAPTYGPAHLRLGEALQRSGRYLEARSALEQAVAVYPPESSARAHRALGLTLLSLGDAQAAANELEAALRIRSDDGVTWKGLAQAYNKLRRGAEARQANERGAKLKETLGYFDDWRLTVLEEAVSPALVEIRIKDKLSMGRTQDAMADALRWEARHPDWPSIKRMIGNMQRSAGNEAEAQRYFDEAKRLVASGHTQ